MEYKKLIACINSENELASSIVKTAKKYSDEGADEFYIYNYTKDQESREEFLYVLKQIKREIDIPFMAGLYVECFDDIKKVFFAGAERIVVKDELFADNREVIDEAIKGLGKDKILMEIDSKGDFANWESTFVLKEKGFAGIVLKHTEASGQLARNIKQCPLPVIIRDSLIRNILKDLIVYENVEGVATNYYRDKNIMKAKLFLKEEGIPVDIFESSLSFEDFKLDKEGLIPVIVQDCRTYEVLRAAYMNEEAYERTVETGEMYYFNKDSQSVWHKGEKSGNYQYVKHLLIDRENGTILAKVKQAGVHSRGGSQSSFATELLRKSYGGTDSLEGLDSVYNKVKERKEHPKEGAYTNYLLEKGMDKILEKCGEEATKIVIAAKNSSQEELKYEIADFLYHLTVLMVEKGLDWEGVIEGLSQKR